MDLLVKSVPGMEGILRRCDLPRFFDVDDANDPLVQFVKTETRQTPRVQALILNTLEDLESPILSYIRTHIPNLYTIGPLNSQLETRLFNQKIVVPSTASGNGSCGSYVRTPFPMRIGRVGACGTLKRPPNKGGTRWTPQEEVLNHPSVSGFLTHGAWNSILGSIVAGVPMICWSYFGDQSINSL
ncbi:7-deoxyloganetic acid glucosyltransferase [Sarracenia purpurea var. burkii]